MVYFFIALFGGLYYCIRYAYDKSKLNAFARDEAERENYYNDLRVRVCTSFENERKIQDYILSGDAYEEICDTYSEDFKFVFGSNWKNVLRIPPKPSVLDPKLYKHDAYSFSVPCNHIYWVYRLILASKGKVVHELLTLGYLAGGEEDRAMCIKFAQRIEKRLRERGVNIRLVMDKRGRFKLDTLCIGSYERMW